MLNKKVLPQIAVYLGVTKKKPIFVLEFVPDPAKPNGYLRWGEPMEMTVVKDEEENPGPGSFVQMLHNFEHRSTPEGFQPEELSEEMEQQLRARRRVAMTLEAFGKINIYPTRHHPGGSGYGNPREGVRGNQRLSDFELVTLARSL